MNKTATITHFADPNTHATLCPLSYGVIQVSGVDAFKFLQGQLSCDLDEITPQQARLACYCNQKGRMLVTFYIWRKNADYFLCLSADLIEATLQQLQKYGMFSQVTINDVTQNYIIVGVAGPNCENVVKVTLETVNNNLYAVTQYKDITLITLPNAVKIDSRLRGGDKGIIPATSTVISVKAGIHSKEYSLRYLLLTTEQHSLEPLKTKLTNTTEAAWHYLDILNQVFIAQLSTCEKFTPQAANFTEHGGVSVTKGCYLGQEIISRLYHLGQCKQALYHFEFQSSTMPAVGHNLNDAKQHPIGTITQVVTLSPDHLLIQAVINKGAYEEVHLD